MEARGRDARCEAAELRERVEFDGDRAIGVRALQRDPHEAVAARRETLFRDRRAEGVPDSEPRGRRGGASPRRRRRPRGRQRRGRRRRRWRRRGGRGGGGARDGEGRAARDGAWLLGHLSDGRGAWGWRPPPRQPGTPAGLDGPTLCFAENPEPVNVCRVCVVELEGARTLVPSCSRTVEAARSRPDLPDRDRGPQRRRRVRGRAMPWRHRPRRRARTDTRHWTPGLRERHFTTPRRLSPRPVVPRSRHRGVVLHEVVRFAVACRFGGSPDAHPMGGAGFRGGSRPGLRQ